MKITKKRAKRDIEKGYTKNQFVAKLRRLADCIEQGKQFKIQVAGELYIASQIIAHGPIHNLRPVSA